ncbi:MAG: hypothetical protein KGR17_00610 [Acidobacteria bacterium]|nr:hypothetical protein [Acidobacteriota bacterium]
MAPTSPTPAPVPAEDAVDALVALVGRDGFAPLRWLDRFGDRISQLVRAEQVGEVLRGGPSPLVVRDGDDVVGGLVWRPLPDLAEIFDHPVHEVVAVLVDDRADRRPVVVAMLGALREQLAGQAGLVMLRLEVDDVEALAGATSMGFTVRETSLTLMNDIERRHLNPPYDPAGMKIHRFADGPLPEEMRNVLRSAPAPIVDDHYHADPRLDDDRCTAIYDRRRDQVLNGVRADVIVYREVDGVYFGFGTFKRDPDVARHGLTLLNDSFGYRPPGSPSGHNRVAAEFMCNEPLLEDARLVQWDTQATNLPMVNMLTGRPSIRFCRASYMLHVWTDEP